MQCVGVNGRFLRFLQALYEGSMCRVKVNGQVDSDDFEVNTRLRQEFVLYYPHSSSFYASMGL